MDNNRTEKRKRGVIIAVTGILFFAVISIVSIINLKFRQTSEKKREEKVPVQVLQVKPINFKWVIEQTGDIKPFSEVKVYPKISGEIIERLFVEKGDYIKKGSLIAALEDNKIRAKLAEAKAALDLAKANFMRIEANLERIKMDHTRLLNLYKEKAVSKQRLDHIKAEFKAVKEEKKLAGAQINQADAVLKQLKILYKDHKIFAPIDGYVSARYIDQGAMSGINQPIIRISYEDKLKIITSVTEIDFPHLKKGMKVDIRTDVYPGKIFPGKISVINPTIDPATRTGEIEIHIANKNLILHSGMFAHIKLYLGERDSLSIPLSALNKLAGTGNYYVYIVEDNKAVLKNIKTGKGQGIFIEVNEGLTEGQLVVVKGQNRLKDGSQVLIVNNGDASL
ncbi:MAG: efflux RND transporter periplasmic adaptor subunit [Thermodesulfobacteriota bacterium]|nr:efflux RND transporter periplasmic adaptor subunit [Thermodesulfobacteriota bacterium]